MSTASTESAAKVQSENGGRTGQAVSAVLQRGKKSWQITLETHPASSECISEEGKLFKKNYQSSLPIEGPSLSFATSWLQYFLETLHEMHTDFLFSKNLVEVAQGVAVCMCMCTQTHRHL